MPTAFSASVIETVVQSISALATAAAAVFAALSARSAARSAREMEQARELGVAPVLTLAANFEILSYHFDLTNGRDGPHPYQGHIKLENHGNGPALNLNVHFRFVPSEASLEEELLIAENDGAFPSKCFANNSGFRWEGRHQASPNEIRHDAEVRFSSLAAGEAQAITIPREIIARWALDAVSFNSITSTRRRHISSLEVTVLFDTVLRPAQRSAFRFTLGGREQPGLGTVRESLGSGVSYECDFALAHMTNGGAALH